MNIFFLNIETCNFFSFIMCPIFFSVVFPSVSLLQKSSSSLISCHATGFFPDTVDLFWMKDGEEFHEGVEKGEILPNDDESFQMSVHLNTSSLTPEDWKHFSCVFQFSGSRGNITVSLDKTKIRSNHDKNKNSARVNTGLYYLIWWAHQSIVHWRSNYSLNENKNCQQKVICFMFFKYFHLALILKYCNKL